MVIEWEDINEKRINYNNIEQFIEFDENINIFYISFFDDPSQTINTTMKKYFITSQIEMEKEIKKYGGEWTTSNYELNAEFKTYDELLFYIREVLVPKILAAKMIGGGP